MHAYRRGGWIAGAIVLGGAVSLHASQLPSFEYSQVHMGMPVRIVLHADDEPAARLAATAAFARIGALDRAMSDYRPDSDIREVARLAPAWVVVSPDVFALVARALEIARATDGAFDPTVGPVVALWRDTRATRRLPDAPALARARALTGWRRVELDAARQAIRLPRAGMQLDLGAIAKGYILQAALSTLGAGGIRSAMVQAGGDIVAGEPPPGRAGWRIEVPGGERAAPAFVALASALTRAALSTSGASRQFVEIGGVRYSHVVDPRTGRALTTHDTAHVIAPDGATADALATAATVVGAAGLPALRRAFPAARIELVRIPTPFPQVPTDSVEKGSEFFLLCSPCEPAHPGSSPPRWSSAASVLPPRGNRPRPSTGSRSSTARICPAGRPSSPVMSWA